jgi:hypothetical protein
MIRVWKSGQAPKRLRARQEHDGKAQWLALVPFNLQADEFEDFLKSRFSSVANVVKYRTPDGDLVFTGSNTAADTQ